MRLCAGLVLSVALCLGMGAAQASAATICAGPETNSFFGRCDTTAAGVREALDAASARAGHDTVLIPAGDYTFETGLV